MKKTVAAALTAAAILGANGTSFAAANPFSDVPAGHWAYNSVAKLAAVGVVEGYGDGTYLGDRNITRYEMAQMIAKAMAKNPQGISKAELDRLVAEFRDELEALGVRVDNLEKYADKVTWHGKIEYTYHQFKQDPFNTGEKAKTTSNGYIFRLDPQAEINDHWTANARLDGEGDMSSDETTDVTLVRAWAEGNYDNFNIKLGKFEFYPENEAGLIWDTEISGAQLTFGNKWKFSVTGGRLEKDELQGAVNGMTVYDVTDAFSLTAPDIDTDPSTVVGLRIDYDETDKGFYGGAGWYYVKDDDFAWTKRSFVNQYYGGVFADDDEAKSAMKRYNKANLWTANLGYKFNEKAKLQGGYVKNTKADIENASWQAEFIYGDYDDASKKGQWSVWTGYRQFGSNATLVGTTEDDAMLGTRGWVIGAAWAPFKNIGVIAKYFNGRYITEGFDDKTGKAQKLFGRVEFFF
ncbi:MAG: putative porin [Selenomonadaceae bacterium]|nr:putative porin [Selenomonadaceae bacterium]